MFAGKFETVSGIIAEDYESPVYYRLDFVTFKDRHSFLFFASILRFHQQNYSLISKNSHLCTIFNLVYVYKCLMRLSCNVKISFY